MFWVTGYRGDGEITYMKKVQYIPDVQEHIRIAFGEHFSAKVEVTRED